jgi:tetratricopeptide (TPR) repeat protein
LAHPPTQRDQDPKAEVEKYRKAMAQDPDSRLFAALADALRRAGDTKAAIAVAEQGIKKHPKYLSGIMVLAQAYFADARYPDALGLFGKVVKLNPENLLAHRAMAEIYDRTGDHELALKAYRAITILDHTDKRAAERLQILEATMPRKPPDRPMPKAPAKPAAPPATPPGKAPAPQKTLTTAPAKATEQPAPAAAPTPEPFPKLPDELAAPGPAPAKKTLSEEEKLDLFFSGKEFSSLGIAAEAEGFEVMGAREALKGPRAAIKPPPAPESRTPPPPSIADIKITRSAMARVFWNQGFRQKALAVMAQEVCEKPNDNDLRAEFVAACRAMGQEHEKIIAQAANKPGPAPDKEDDKKAAPAEQPEPPQPAPATAPEPEPPEPEEEAAAEVKTKASNLEWFQPPVSRPAAAMRTPAPGPARAQALRKYLDKIKGKENKP